MKTEEQHLEYIDRFLEGKLSGPEQQSFREMLDSDPAFAGLYQDVITLKKASRLSQLQAKLNMLRAFEEKSRYPMLKERNPNYRRMRYVFAAAAVILLFLIGKFWFTSISHTEADLISNTPLVAVFPFENHVLDTAYKELYDGLVQGIPRKLARTTNVRPVSFYSVDQAFTKYAHSEVPDALGSDYILDGSITETPGKGIKILAKISDHNSNQTVWDTTLNIKKEFEAYLDAENIISLAAEKKLSTSNRSPFQNSLYDAEVTTNMDAYTAYLKAEKFWMERTDSSLFIATILLDSAASFDSTSAAIKGLSALVFTTIGEKASADKTVSDRKEAFDLARSYALQAIALNKQSAEAYLALADISETMDYDYAQATLYLQKAKNIKPNDADIHRAFAELMIKTGDIPKGDAHVQLARSLDPENLSVHWLETKYLMALGFFDESRAVANEIMKKYPDFVLIKTSDWNYHMIHREYDLAIVSIPEDYDQEYKLIMEGMAYIEQEDYASLYALYTEGHLPESLNLLVLVQQDKFEEARNVIEKMLSDHDFFWRSHIQTLPINIFRKMKADPGIRKIFKSYGIKLHESPEPPSTLEI